MELHQVRYTLFELYFCCLVRVILLNAFDYMMRNQTSDRTVTTVSYITSSSFSNSYSSPSLIKYTVMYACFHGHAGLVTAFLNEGADADFKNMAGRTALQLAQKAGFEDASKAILDGPTIMVNSSYSIHPFKSLIMYLLIVELSLKISWALLYVAY